MSVLADDMCRPPSLDYEIPTSLLRNASIASHRTESPAEGCFRLFPDFPIEIRIKIWGHAISIPRIVEIEKFPCWQHGSLNEIRYFPDCWHYKIRNPPPLLSVSSESRNEAMKDYNCSTNDSITCTGNPPWVRFDYDILHLKVRRWTRNREHVAHEWSEYDVRSWSLPPENISGGRFSKKRECFKTVQALAINRELFFATADCEESVMRSVFPNLKLLIVLIDDDVDIQKQWKVRRQDYSLYENDEIDSIVPRWAFTSASTGPFSPISRNFGYQYYLEKLLQFRFKMEGKKANYVAPHIVVMGCSLPAGLEIPACGRRPRESSLESRPTPGAEAEEPCDSVDDETI